VFLNHWGLRGVAPSDNAPVKVIVDRFSFTPEK
jgi:hypothetical protein